MQKKSLLVALFCGALCLTGCLKNEESASVTQVRTAKANELNSIAKLNEAKAAAEAVYAEAELTVAQAEAKLREANAALVLAQAETEKVRAELLKVQVEMSEVLVDEELVKLQLLEADLEKHLAEVEAAVAKAEAEKQGWINVLEHAIAAAEAQAIADEQAILQAEKNLEDYVATMEADKAAKAKWYADLYFNTLNEVQIMQQTQLKVKAQKVLVENGAKAVREVIYNEIDEINKKIARNDEVVAYLKEHQSESPEKAEADLKAARIALEEAYNKYQEAVTAEGKAKDAYSNTEGTGVSQKKADFNKNAWAWTTKVNAEIPIWMRATDDVAITETANVTVYGMTITGEDGEPEFLPLWNNQATGNVTVRYPEVYVSTYKSGKATDFEELTTTVYAPATIYYDNIKQALDTAIAHRENMAEFAAGMAEFITGWQIEQEKAKVEELTEKNKLHQKYVDAHKAEVTKAEADYVAELGKVKTYQTEKDNAWKAFQEYMVLKTNVSRKFFKDRFEADSAYRKAYADSAAAGDALEGVKAGIVTLVSDFVTALENESKAEGAYKKAINDATTDATVKPLYNKYETALSHWNPKFDKTQPYKLFEGDGWYNVDANGAKIAGTKAEDKQAALAQAKKRVEDAQEALRKAQMDLWRTAMTSADSTSTGFKAAEAELKAANTAYNSDAADGVKKQEALASKEYGDTKSAYELAVGANKTVAATEAAWNEAFGSAKDRKYVEYPDPMSPNTAYKVNATYDETAKVWKYEGKTAGTSQAALIVAVKAIVDAKADAEIPTTVPTSIDENSTTGEIWAYFDDKLNNPTTGAEPKLVEANIALIEAIKGKPYDAKKDKIEDYLDEEADNLYRTYLNVKPTAKVDEAKEALKKAYAWNPDEIGQLSATLVEPTSNKYNTEAKAKQAKFGWLISKYNVDYEATMVNEAGETVSIASYLYPWAPGQNFWTWNPYEKSFKYQIEEAQDNIDVVLPQQLVDFKDALADGVKTYKDETIANILKEVNAYKAYESDYKAWITDCEKAQKAWNEAKKVKFDTGKAKDAAEDAYKAAKAIADGGMWVYDPESKILVKAYPKEADRVGKHANDFTWIKINDAIEAIEGGIDNLATGVEGLMTLASSFITEVSGIENPAVKTTDQAKLQSVITKLTADGALYNIDGTSTFELKVAKKLLEKALQYGKIGLGEVIEYLDEEIEELNEKIEIYIIIASQYKAIMNAYLGIVDDETGPLEDEEGDEE